MPSYPTNEQYVQRHYAFHVQGVNTFVTQNTSTVRALWGMPGLRVVNKLPNWRETILAGGNASLPYSVRLVRDWRIRKARLICSDRDYSLASSEMMWHGDCALTTGVTDPITQDQALAAIKRKLASQVKAFNLLVPLAEIKDLRRTVIGATDLTISLVHELARIRKTRGRSAFKYASKAWLTYGFGIQPIMSDIKAIGSSITAHLTKVDRKNVRLVGGASKQWVSAPAGTNSVTYNLFASLGSKHRVEHSLSYRYVGGFHLPLKSGNDYGAMQHFGLTLPSLVPALWELTAFSWVADYFGTIGAFLEDTFAAPSGVANYLTLNRLYTARVITDVTPKFPVSPPVGFKIHLNVNGYAEGVYVEFERTLVPGNTLPRRALRFRTVDEMGLFGVNKLLNLVSVLGASAKA